MSSTAALLWLVAFLVGITALAQAWRFVCRQRKHRARKLQFLRSEYASRPARLATQPGAFAGGMDRDRAAGIRKHAEAWAKRVASGEVREARNPCRPGTPEYVLWLTSFHLRLAELEESAAPAGAEVLRAAPDGLARR